MTDYLKQLEQINAVYSKTNAAYGKWAKKQGLSYNSLMMLYIMEGKASCTQKFICEELMLPKSTVHSILLDYIRKGYMQLQVSPDSKKEKRVVLTDAGKAFSADILSRLHAMEIKAMEKLGPDLCSQMVYSNVLYCDIFQKEVDQEDE